MEEKSVLKGVLRAFEEAEGGALTVDLLAARLGVEKSALQGMLDFWVRKGRLREVGGGGGTFAVASCAGGGPFSCVGCGSPNGCAFASPRGVASRAYVLVRK